MKLVWSADAWAQYLWWQSQDRAVVHRINRLLDDIMRNPEDTGIGKAKILQGKSLAGYRSRRINQEHRLVYKIVGDELRIASCRYHYE